MKRRDATAGADADAFRDCRERGTGHGGIGIRTAKRVEMAFGSPNGFKAVAIEILRAFQHEPILVAARRVVVAPHEEAETKGTLRRQG